MEMKHGFVSTSAKVSLTQFGRRLTEDMVRLGTKDGVSIWFSPLLTSSYGKQALSRFDTFEKVTISTHLAAGRVVLNYKVTL